MVCAVAARGARRAALRLAAAGLCIDRSRPRGPVGAPANGSPRSCPPTHSATTSHCWESSKGFRPWRRVRSRSRSTSRSRGRAACRGACVSRGTTRRPRSRPAHCSGDHGAPAPSRAVRAIPAASITSSGCTSTATAQRATCAPAPPSTAASGVGHALATVPRQARRAHRRREYRCRRRSTADGARARRAIPLHASSTGRTFAAPARAISSPCRECTSRCSASSSFVAIAPGLAATTGAALELRPRGGRGGERACDCVLRGAHRLRRARAALARHDHDRARGAREPPRASARRSSSPRRSLPCSSGTRSRRCPRRSGCRSSRSRFCWCSRRRGRWLRATHGRARRAAFAALEFVRLQWSIGLALLPMTACYFGEISLVGPLVNLVAIPFFNLVSRTAHGAHDARAVVRRSRVVGDAPRRRGCVARGLHRARAARRCRTARGGARVAAGAAAGVHRSLRCGVALAVGGAALPGRRLAWLALLPLASSHGARAEGGQRARCRARRRPRSRDARRDARRTVCCSMPGRRRGPVSTAASRSCCRHLPREAARGLDRLIVSHSDNDHAGGAAAVVAAFPEVDVLAGPTS